MKIWPQLNLVILLAMGGAASNTSQACIDLANHFTETPPRALSAVGVKHPVTVYMIRGDPAQRALAIAVKLFLQHLLGFRDVKVQEIRPSIEEAIKRFKSFPRERKSIEAAIIPGVRLTRLNSSQKELPMKNEMSFYPFKIMPLRLRVQLTQRALTDPSCNFSETDWLRFTVFSQSDCNFSVYDATRHGQFTIKSEGLERCTEGNFCATLLVPDAYSNAVEKLKWFLDKFRLKLAPVPWLTRNETFGNHSQLLLSGYDLEPEYYFMHNLLLIYDKRTTYSVTDFGSFATNVDLGAKLSAEVNSTDVEDKACKYLLKYKHQIKMCVRKENSTVFMRYYLCKDDPDREVIEKAMKVVEDVVRQRVNYTPKLLLANLSCESGFERAFEKDLRRPLSDDWLHTGAMVAPKADDKVKELVNSQETLVMLYETQIAASKVFPVFLATADWDSLIVAAAAWLKSLDIKKITLNFKNKAQEEIEKLQEYFYPPDFYVQSYKKTTTVQAILMDAEAARQSICEIITSQTSPPTILVFGEWNPKSSLCSVRQMNRQPFSIWTISGAWPGGSWAMGTLAKAGADLVLHQRLQSVFGDSWPSKVTPLIDAVLTATFAIDSLRQHHPEFNYDIHGDNVTSRLLSDIVRKSNIKGITQSIHYHINHTLVEPLLFVTKWENGSKSCLQTIIRVTNISVTPVILWSQGHREAIENVSLSLLFYIIVIGETVTLLSVVGYKMKRWLSKRSRRHDLTQLAALELQRDEFEMNEKISGRVFLALQRGKYKTFVAVKTPLADPAGAAVLTWEARVLASLRHQNVVRLVGIVMEGSPPLLVLEYAVRGNLRRYLEEVTVGSWRHVPAVLLTRLSKEAAAALAYLTLKNIVHCNVRASNCLVDAHGVLKLTNFSMARALSGVVSEDMDMGQYQCRQRGLFPVLWMAPESLKRGIFSPASDMWSYGVLLVEIVTMGARPYGAYTPDAVIRHVTNGGTPLLPPDASNDMRTLAQQCWTLEVGARLTAAQALKFLERAPAALTPCAPVAFLSLPPTLSPPPAPLSEGRSENNLERVDELKVFKSCSI